MSVLSPPRTEKALPARFLVFYPAGARIYREGDIGTEMFTIRSGVVEITQSAGSETRMLARLEKGDFFGEASLLEDIPREATARAKTDVELIRINGAIFESMLREAPDIAVRMMRKLSKQARETSASLDEILGRRAPPMVPPGRSADAAGAVFDPKLVTPQLVSPDRTIRFPVNPDGDTILGRADPVTGINPDVDLTPLDSQRTVSRRHARLYSIGGELYVMEEIGVVNGTFVNGVKLQTGSPAVLHHGDDLKLGFVALTFWRPTA